MCKKQNKRRAKVLMSMYFSIENVTPTVLARIEYRSAVTKHKILGKVTTVVKKPKRKALGMNGFYTIELRLLKEGERLKVGTNTLSKR